ncbi:GNAT family N-acetyltransferase [Ktedonosporobacter rubrisoli]|uniref:GNAT family N-acetyltransferase n=1 Tax=Ktedonosporobacter rubrisoli TaxID=2509675 RepID=A0A4P6JJZ7_KTERU|nr:GNAT family N-acetyltransferase [Ktedonosporobacter rubrisoli]QBD75282.1 GNAT family N-acetyltransferase [Ktedonosporobacter rubrisoli]
MGRAPILCMQIDEDLQLRLLETCYAEEYYRLIDRNRTHLGRWMPWVKYENSPETTKAYIHQSLVHFANDEAMQTSIWYRGQLIGSIGFPRLHWSDRTAEIGYWLDAEAQGRGVITRACRALINYAFERYNMNKVEIHTAVGNVRSRAVPERLGFTLESIIPQHQWLHDRYVDVVIYGLFRRDWQG